LFTKGRGKHLCLDDKQRLPFTDACMMETMRLGIALPLGIPHSARVDSKLGKYYLNLAFLYYYVIRNF